jgi:precorrin-8X/cobalt-precorrin-8 methylmutase
MSNSQNHKEAIINEILRNPVSPERIETLSMECIENEAPMHSFSGEEWTVVKRMIHTTADFSLMNDVVFSPGAVDSAVAALRAESPIYTDSNMIRVGLSIPRLKSVSSGYGSEKIHCHVADKDVAERAIKAGLPRSLFAVKKAEAILNRGIAVFGNAPVALLELNRMVIEEGLAPALVIGMPVGFVHVMECKEELVSLGVPSIAIRGRRGGSPLAVSVVHALCSIAANIQP